MRLIDKQQIAIERWNVDARSNSNPHESDFGHNLGITPRDPALQNVYYINVWTELTLANMVTTQNVIDIRTHSSFRIEILHGEQITDEFFFSLLNLAQTDFNNCKLPLKLVHLKVFFSVYSLKQLTDAHS